jgi:hypothetical protein
MATKWLLYEPSKQLRTLRFFDFLVVCQDEMSRSYAGIARRPDHTAARNMERMAAIFVRRAPV